MLKKRLTILLLLAIVFFFVYSYLNFQIPLNPPLIKGETEGDLIFNSPDETSAYYFSKLFAETGELSRFEPLNFVAPGLIHPRSVLVNSAGYLVPGSFLGMPLIYGSLSKFFNFVSSLGDPWSPSDDRAVPFFTPFFAVLGVFAFYFLLRKIWGENIAFLSAVLMFFLPPYWYYATRTMFPNVLFVSLLIISAAFFFGIPITLSTANENAKNREKVYEYVRYVGGGLFLGLALITRTSEIVWVGILGLFLIIYFLTPSISPYFRKAETGGEKVGVYWSAAVLGFAVFCLTFLPVFYQNKILYGSYFGSGYNIPKISNSQFLISNEISNPKFQIQNLKIKIENLIKVVFPFGIHPRLVWQNFWDYFIKFFWWFTIPILIGCLIFIFALFRVLVSRCFAIKNFFNSPQLLYFLSFLFISVYLFIYYGSWRFSDNINFQKITIGTSYLRYWLPIFVMGLPFVVLFFKNVVATFRLRRLKPAATILVLGFLCFSVFMSAVSVFTSEDEGLFYVKNNLLRYNEIRQVVLNLTEENSIIITERSDKIFFPERKIIVAKRGEIPDIKNLIKFIPIYYYNIAFTNKELAVFNQKLSEQGMKLELVKVFGNEGIYKIISPETTNSSEYPE